MSHYTIYKNTDLRRMLKKRGLRVFAVKATLVARLTTYDIEHPFPFLNLPAEVRNEIYKYISAAETKPRVPKKKLNLNQDLPTHTEIREMANRAGTSQPGLFSTCTQIRNESRGLFYRYHTFKLHIWQEKDEGLWSRFYAWLYCLRREKSRGG